MLRTVYDDKYVDVDQDLLNNKSGSGHRLNHVIVKSMVAADKKIGQYT